MDSCNGGKLEPPVTPKAMLHPPLEVPNCVLKIVSAIVFGPFDKSTGPTKELMPPVHVTVAELTDPVGVKLRVKIVGRSTTTVSEDG
jgi:hypothetical protein